MKNVFTHGCWSGWYWSLLDQFSASQFIYLTFELCEFHNLLLLSWKFLFAVSFKNKLIKKKKNPEAWLWLKDGQNAANMSGQVSAYNAQIFICACVRRCHTKATCKFDLDNISALIKMSIEFFFVIISFRRIYLTPYLGGFLRYPPEKIGMISISTPIFFWGGGWIYVPKMPDGR